MPAALYFARPVWYAPVRMRKMRAIQTLQPHVRALARRFAGQAPSSVDVDVRDLEQDAYVGILEALPRYNGSTQLSTFMGRRIHGSMVDGLRRWDPRPRRSRGPRKVVWEALDDSPEDRWHAPTVDPLVALQHAELRKAVGQLDARSQHLLRLYYVDDHTLEQIAPVIGVSESRVSMLRKAAIEQLREILT